MLNHRRSCRPLHLILTALACAALLFPDTTLAMSQRDWMITLVDGLGRSFGLPDEPQAADYARILQGKRSFRFEAEVVRAESGEASTHAFTSYGPFSGSGWLLGTSRPTEVPLRFTLPLDGRYRLAAAVRLPGHKVQAGGVTFTADGDRNRFSPVILGEIDLAAGPQEIIVTLPPGGAIDYFELQAPNLPAIAPAAGWQPDVPLTWEVLALTAVQALHLETQLPAAARIQAVEAETAVETGGARVVRDTHLGRPSGGLWVRTAARAAVVVVPVTLDTEGYFDIDLTLMGKPVSVLINGHLELRVDGKPYLDKVSLAPVLFPAGASLVQISLPPGGGLDRLEFRARRSDLPTLLNVLGLEGKETAPVAADLDRLSRRLTDTTR